MKSNYHGNPLLIKLSSGEEIVTGACNFDEYGGFVVMNNPYYVVKILKGDRISYQLEKWMPYTENEDFPVDIRQIISYNSPSIDFLEYYYMVIKDDQEEERLYEYGEDYSGQVH